MKVKKKISNKKQEQKSKRISYAVIDKQISEEIDFLTINDSKVWNAPKQNRRENVHGFFQYPAMMVPSVQKVIIDCIVRHNTEIKNMLDPFMGASTSIVASMHSGLNCFGQDINPLAVLLSKVKTGGYYYNSYLKRANSVVTAARNSKSKRIVKNFQSREKWFKPSVSIELSNLVIAIRKEKSIHTRRLLWVTLAETVRLTSNDRTSTFKLHSRPIEEIQRRNISPIDVFELLISKNIEDIKSHADILKKKNLISRGTYKNKVSISLLDSSKKIKMPDLGRFNFDLLVSSPPYGDNKTTIPYGQHAFLPLQWIDLTDIDNSATDDYLRTTLEIDSRSLGGKEKSISVNELFELLDKTPTLNSIIKKLSKSHPDKVKKVVNFIFDFDSALNKIYEAVRINGYFVWTIGNRNVGKMEIRNDKILEELMLYRGAILIKTISRKILNKRMASRNDTSKTMNKEKILIFRKAK